MHKDCLFTIFINKILPHTHKFCMVCVEGEKSIKNLKDLDVYLFWTSCFSLTVYMYMYNVCQEICLLIFTAVVSYLKLMSWYFYYSHNNIISLLYIISFFLEYWSITFITIYQSDSKVDIYWGLTYWLWLVRGNWLSFF